MAEFIIRTCSKEYKFPHGNIYLEKGTSVFIPVIEFHKDSRYFPNPEVFDPERFSAENKSKIKPYSFIPFGHGPRNCIGKKLYILEHRKVQVHSKYTERSVFKVNNMHQLMKCSYTLFFVVNEC